jgi:DNA-binding response OmpR family regulator
MSPTILDHSPCVLLVETDPDLANKLSCDLKEAGYTPVVAPDTAIGFRQACELEPALVVVDRALGGESGLQLCDRIRSSGSRVPMLLLMSGDTVQDRVACLDAGADDYFLKPYRSETFLQWVRLYLQPEAVSSEELQFSDLILDLSTRQAMRNGRLIDLTMKEFELLRYLMSHPREPLSREKILENVWGYDFMGESNVIEVYIRYLRLKIEYEGEKRLIQTVRGIGYVLREA